jgi:hypothetical protein
VGLAHAAALSAAALVSLDAMLSQPQVRRAGAGIDYQSKH